MGRRATLLATLLLALSGCATFGPPPAPTATVTPAPVPNGTTAGGGATEFAPGVTEDGVVDAPRLATAHARTLGRESFSVNQTIVERFTNGTTVSRYVTRGRFAGADRSVVRLDQRDRENGRIKRRLVRRYNDGQRLYREVTEDGGSRTDELPFDNSSSGGYRATLTNQGPIAQVFGLVETTTDGRFTENGTRYVRIVTDEPASVPPLRNVTVTAVVSERGVVRSYRVTYFTVRNSRQTAVTVSLSYSDIGTTAVSRPAWVDATEPG
jgi:hypothetical protein